MRTELFRVVVTGHSFITMDPEREILEGVAEVIETQPVNDQELIEAAQNADAILNQNSYYTRSIIEKLQKCRAIVHYGIGTDKVDSVAAADHGIVVCRIPDYCVEEVATHTLALLLGFERQLYFNMHTMKQGKWLQPEHGSTHRLHGRTFGLLGFGNIARRVAELLQPLNMRIITSDPFIDPAVIEKYGVELVSFEELLSQSQYLSLHTMLNDKTQGIMNESAFKRMRNDAVLINASRGGLVVQQDLIWALREGLLRGAALDVYKPEPLEMDSPLLDMDNVLLTPHTAWYSDEAEIVLKRQAAQEVLLALTGKPPMNPVNVPVKK